MRKIIHVDMDAFYAAVEQRDHPHLRGKPVAVGGSSQRGVVATASYEARPFGVRSAMPSWQAIRRCPDLIFVKPRFEVYRAVSQQIRAIFHEAADLVEPLSLDEAYLDVTNDKWQLGSATLVAQEVKRRIHETTGLTASAGVSYNKFLAKIASDQRKPNGLFVITPPEAESFLEALPVEKFHGIGKVTAARLHQMNLRTGADLKACTEADLTRWFGKVGKFYYQIVRGVDERPVNPNRIRKSVGAERTFSQNLTQLEAMKEVLGQLAERIEDHLQAKEATVGGGRTLTLKVRYGDFTQLTRSFTDTTPLHTAAAIAQAGVRLLQEVDLQERDVRLLGLSVSNLVSEASALPEDQPTPGTQLVLPFLKASG